MPDFNRSNIKKALNRLSEKFKKNPCTFEQTVNEVFNFFKNKGIKREGAIKIVIQLIREQSIIPGKKHTSQTILDNPTRRSIFNYINREKVTYYSEIKLQLGLRSENMYRIHLESLENFGLIKSDLFGIGKGIRLLYRKDIDKEKAGYYYRLKDKIHFDIIMLLCKKGPLRLVDINAHLKVDAKHTVKNLVEIDLIINKDTIFSINPRKREDIKQIVDFIIIKKKNNGDI